MEIAPIADTGRHDPPGDPTWQESFFLGWCDAKTRSGGAHHVSLNPHLGLAHVWSWAVVHGQPAGRRQEHKLPLPDDDLRDFRLARHHFKAGPSIRALELSADFDGGLRLELGYCGFHDPVVLNDLRPQGRHYESMGRVTGRATVGGREVAIAGSGWQDHSWGPRNYAATLSERWMYAIFGDDLAFSLYHLHTSQGVKQFGYALDRGRLEKVSRVDVRVGVAPDGMSPTDCQAAAWDASGAGHGLDGTVFATSLTGGPGWSGTGAYFGMNGLTRFRCGGRLGEGVVEVAELKALQADDAALLRIP